MTAARYPYLRAYARYVGQGDQPLAKALFAAALEGAPADAYARADGGARWLTLGRLETQAQRGSIVAAYLLHKIREYAGEPVAPDPSTEPLKRARAL